MCQIKQYVKYMGDRIIRPLHQKVELQYLKTSEKSTISKTMQRLLIQRRGFIKDCTLIKKSALAHHQGSRGKDAGMGESIKLFVSIHFG